MYINIYILMHIVYKYIYKMKKSDYFNNLDKLLLNTYKWMKLKTAEMPVYKKRLTFLK